MRSGGDALLDPVDELISAARATGAAAEIYHMQASAKEIDATLPLAIAKVEAARLEGLRITADMYAYAAVSTGLDAAMPTGCSRRSTRSAPAVAESPVASHLLLELETGMNLDIAAEHRARAAQDRAKAAATALPNVRALHLRAADAWDEMAQKVEYTSERAAENKAAREAIEGSGSGRI